MRVSVLEVPASWGDPHAVLASIDAELERGPAADLVLLPEASLTGYVSTSGAFDLAAFAEPIDGPTARALAAVAQRRRTNLVAPLVLLEEGRCFNAMVAFDRQGARVFTYRKRHPWIPETWATPGPDPAPVVAIDGVRVSIAICFDVHFLEEEAAAALDDADLLLFPSAWVEQKDSRRMLLADLARAHRVAIANANWGPGVVQIGGQGASTIYDERGAIVATAPLSSSMLPRVTRADATLELAVR